MFDLLEKVKYLTEHGLMQIFAQESKQSKRKLLLHLLKIQEFDEEEDLRGSICINYCLDAIEFASNQGFQWRKVLLVLQFCVELLTETANKGINLQNAVAIMKEKLPALSTNLTTTEAKKFLDYLFDTFFQHYSLYLFCMTEDRYLDLTMKHSLIEVPKSAEPLSTGTDLETWNYQQKLGKIEEENYQICTERADKLQSTLKEIEQQTTQQTENLNEICGSADGSDLKDVLQTLTNLHVKYMEAEIQNSLDESRGNVEYALKKSKVSKPDTAKLRPTSKNRPRSKNKNKLAPH